MSKKIIKKEIISINLDYKNTKPQNKIAMSLSNFSGGVHEKSNKAKRKKDKMKLKKELKLNNFGSFFVVIVIYIYYILNKQ